MEGQQILFSNNILHYFDIYYGKNETFLYAKEKASVIEAELNVCGYFCIVTSEKMSAEQALILYKGRDVTEKLFSSNKTFLGARSMRVHSQEALSAKIFIEFIALIIRNRIYTLLKEELLKIDTRGNYMSVPEAIRELEKIEMVRRSNGMYRLDHAVTKRQKTILSAFGLDQEYVRMKAHEIGTLLAEGQSLIDTSAREGEN